MKEDSLSQVIRHTIEKIDKVPKDTIVELLKDLYEEREMINSLLNIFLRRAVFITDASCKLLFFNDFCFKFGILISSGNKVVFEENFFVVVDNVIRSMKEKKLSFHFTEVSVNSNRDMLDKVLIEKIFGIECYTKDFEFFHFVVSDKTEEALNKMDRIQEESLSSLSNVVSGIAHEIKNPLSAMYLHAKILRKILEKDTFDKNYVIKELDVILSEIDRLNNIVNDFMFSLRPYKFVEKYENINNIVKETVDFFLPEFKDKGIRIEVVLDESLPMVLCDKSLVKQAIINLIKNSIDAVRYGEGVVEIKTYFLSRFDGDFVVIEVKDNGVGIPDDVKSRIFEPFFTTKENGTGIGLSVVYKIAKIHKGNVDFSSKQGETVFRLFLPIVVGTKELKYDVNNKS